MSPRHPHGLLDTSVVVALGSLSDSRVLPRRCFISAITLAELSVGPLVAKSPGERIARQAVLQQVEADFQPLPFDDSAARAFGRVAAQLRNTGRKTTARAYDALIAATALANDLPVFTRNLDDFSGIESLSSSQCRRSDCVHSRHRRVRNYPFPDGPDPRTLRGLRRWVAVSDHSWRSAGVEGYDR